jgi:putative nucleotidyltransferase-like protein
VTRRWPPLGLAERQLLVACAQLEPDASARSRIERLLAGPLDWDAIVAHAELHSVGPLLHHQLRQLEGAVVVPAPARHRLLRLFHRAGYQQREYARALDEILGGLAEGDGPVIVPKGIVLSEVVYGRAVPRPLIDLVLLVKLADVTAMRARLARLGYAPAVPHVTRRFYRWRHAQLHLLRSDGFPIHLLLQWDLVNWPQVHGLDLGRVWADARPAHVAGRLTRVLAPADLLVHLCLQPHKHGFVNLAAAPVADPLALVFELWTNNRLIRFADIHEVLRHHADGLEPAGVIERARAAGIGELVRASLLMVGRLYGPERCQQLLDGLPALPPPRVQRWLLASLAKAPPVPGRVAAPLRAVSLGSAGLPRPRFVRLLQLAGYVFPRLEALRARLGLRSAAAARAAYGFHVVRALLACATGLGGELPWRFARRAARPGLGTAPPVGAGDGR